jgi:hypothetical protein
VAGKGALPAGPPTTCTDFDAEEESRSITAQYRSRSPEEKADAPADQGGVLGRLLGFFGLGKQKAKDASASLDRTVFRGRVEALLQRLQTHSSDAQARLVLLRSLAVELEMLFRDLVAAGDRHESVERLGKQLVTLRQVLLEASPPASAVEQHHLFIVTALRDWLTIDSGGASPSPGGPAPARREGFWK